MSQVKTAATKRLLDSLPAIFQQDESDEPAFLTLYLRAFERILFGGVDFTRSDPGADSGLRIPGGLEEQIARIPSLFDPRDTPEEFLPWLASWAALSFHPALSPERRRNLLAHVIPLYRVRGTRRYLEELLALCLDAYVSITDKEVAAFQLGDHSTIGVESYLGGSSPHFFSVQLIAPGLDEQQKTVQKAIAESIISLAKPAHTVHELALVSPRMQVGMQSTVGMDTVLASD